MAYNTKNIINDAGGKPVPQYYNEKTDQYEVIKGRHGANDFHQVGTVVKESWSGSATVTKSFGSAMQGFAIINDGGSDLSFTIGTITITVKVGESYEDLFGPFTSVTITTSSAYRALVRE